MDTILNWREWNDAISLSGQPSEDQLADLQKQGVTHVINLGPHTNKGALEDEAGSVAALGMTYVYIPVDFEAPTDADFVLFCDTLQALKGNRIHVHCIYNARVSAFFYRYAKASMGGSVDHAFALMDSIWKPGQVWATFIGNDADVSLPNRYAGYDY